MQFPFNRKVLLASAVALATQTSLVNAAGFGVNENSASSMGTAYAGRASNAEDASIGASNPAGIALLDRQQVTVGSAVVLEGGNFENGSFSNNTANNNNTISSESDGFLKTTAVPFGHFAMPVNDKFVFGLNAYAPYGINIDYDDEFAGRWFGDKTVIQNVNLQSTFAYKIQDDLSVGVGLAASHISGELTQKKYKDLGLGVRLSKIDAVVEGDDLAFTWNLGVVWQPTEKTTFGASYHAPTKFTLDGDITANNVMVGPVDQSFKHKGELEVTMPEKVMFSGTHQLNDRWTVMADLMWTRWSRLDSITIEDKEASGVQDGTAYVKMDWRNVWAFSMGTAYELNNQWTLKAGYMFDQSPVTNDNRTVRAPDADRNWFTAGAKWDATEDMTFDFAAAYVMLKDGTITENEYHQDDTIDEGYGTLTGEYKDQSSWVLSAQMTYRF